MAMSFDDWYDKKYGKKKKKDEEISPSVTKDAQPTFDEWYAQKYGDTSNRQEYGQSTTYRDGKIVDDDIAPVWKNETTTDNSQVQSDDWSSVYQEARKLKENADSARVGLNSKKGKAYQKQKKQADAAKNELNTYLNQYGFKNFGELEKEATKDEAKYFQKGALEDGDVKGAIKGTVRDAETDVGTGFMGMWEKLVDGIAMIAAANNETAMRNAANDAIVHKATFGGGISNDEAENIVDEYNQMAAETTNQAAQFVAGDLYDERKVANAIIAGVHTPRQFVRNGKLTLEGLETAYNQEKDYIENDMEADSVLAEKSDAIAETTGHYLAQLTATSAGVPWWAVAGTSAMGSEAENALNEGATFHEAGLSGTISAGGEILSEMMFGGPFSKTGLDDVLAKKFSNVCANKVAASFLKFTLKSGGEGVEEVPAELFTKFGQWITYQDEKTFKEMFLSEEAMESYADAFVGGVFLGGMGQTGEVIKSKAHGVDYVTGLTKNEKAVVDKVYNEELEQAEKDGKKLTEREKAKLYDKVQNRLERGEIDTDTIEELLGGETYETYRKATETDEANLKELAEMYEGEELQKQIESYLANTDTNGIKTKLSNEVYGLVKDSRLGESYVQRGKRGKAFTADLTQIEEKYRGTYKKAVESGILNDTRKTHDFVDLIARISADKGVEFDFTNNKRIAETSFAVEGKTVNGYVDGNTVGLNIDSHKALEKTVGHEISHVLEGTELFEDFQSAAFEYAKSKKATNSKFKNEYWERLYNARELYKNVEGYQGADGFAKIKKEVTADLVGDYIFTDEAFVRNLSTNNRNVFEKIYDEIKYLCKVATAGSEQAKQLEKVKHLFEKVYREGGNINANKEVDVNEPSDAEIDDVKYSIEVKDENTLNSLNEQIKKGEYNAETNPNGGYYVTYKSMSYWGEDENGNAILRSPMAEYVDGELSNAYLLPKDKSKLKWYQATETLDENTGLPTGLMVKVKKEGNKSFSYLPAAENQDLINDDWSNLYFNLQKKVLKNGKWTNSDVPARYNPYEHSSNSMLNDQFSAAYLRDNLVTVKMYVPVSEDNGTFRAKYSKDATGWADWKTGTVAGKINKQKDLQRKVYLSRYAAPVEIVPDSEVAQAYKEYLDGTDVTIPDNVVSPNLLNELKKAGVPITESGKVKYSLSEDNQGNKLSPAVQKRFANSKVVDENGDLKVVYHGTASGEFTIFDKAKGNVEGDFGSGFYFTDSEHDVANNYEGGGPDFEQKVYLRAEQIRQEEEGIDHGMSIVKAREELYKGSFKHSVYLNIENPAIVGETNLLDYDSFAEEYDRNDYDTDEDYEADVEYLIQDKIDEILWDIEKNVDIYSTDGIAEVLWNAVNEGGIDIEQLKANINNLYLEDNNGNLVGNEVTRQIIESLGYDGIIDNTVSTKFNMNLDADTTHYIVFKPNQIKSMDNQNPTDNPDIRYSLSDAPLDNKQNLVYNGERGEGYVQTSEFRKLQAECQGMSNEDIQLYHSGSKQIDERLRANLARVLRTQIDSYRNGLRNDNGILKLSNKDNQFNMCQSVDGSLFHDVFEIAQKHLRNGELVDLHETETTEDHGIGYKYCNNYLSEDGLSGFSITPDGDLISVFNANNKKGFLGAIAPVVKENAKTLDCYNSPNQPLRAMYEKMFGFKTASIMDYNMEYDHDNIAENHGMPKVAFMVNTESDVETRTFTEDQYDEAVEYRNSFVNQAAENVAPVQNSLSQQAEAKQPNLTYGEDIKLDIAPTKETKLADDIAPMTEDEANALQDELFNSITDADAPPEVETYYDSMPDTSRIDDKALNNIGKTLRETLYLDAKQTKAIQDIVQEYSTNEMPSNDELFDTIKEKFGEIVWRDKNTEIADVKRTLRNTKINVSQYVKAGIDDYSNFRKSHSGKIHFAKDGIGVDVAYQELSEMYPDFFPADITNPADQLLRMGEVADLEIYSKQSQQIDDATIQQAVDIISSEVSGYKNDLTRQAAEDTASEALYDIAPPRAEQLASGARGDALLNQSLDNYPIKTVEDKIAEKIRAVNEELNDNKVLRREAMQNYDNQIAELSQEYANLKNKNTKKANDIIRRVVRLEQLKASNDANYSKRISDLEARLEKMNSPKYNKAMHKKAKMQEYADFAKNLIGDTLHWVDKKLGLQYATNTEHRNLRDIVRDENGNKDIARADAINEELSGKYNQHEAELKRELTQIRKKYADLKITKAEDAYIQMLGELRGNPDTTLTEKVVNEYYEKHKNKIDKAKVEKVVEMARQDYDSLLNRVNEVLREQGMKEIPYRQGYFPHFTEPKQNFVQKLLNWKTQDNDIPTSIAGLTEDFKPVKSWQSFDKTRYSDETDYSFMKGFDNYSKGALDWVYHLEDIQKRRAVENYIRYTHSDEGIQARIKEVYADETLDADEAQAKIEHILAEAKNPLNNFVQDFMTHTNILAGKKNSLDRAVEQGTNRHIYSVMTNVQNRMSANMVLANVRSALTNFIPITQSWAQVSPLRSLQATKDTIANAIKDDGTINKSTFLTNRLRNPDNLYNTNWDKVLDKAGIMFEIVDNFSSQVIWRSKYNDNLAKGMSESQAIKNADQFAENVMAGRSKGNEPTLFNAKNPLVKAFTMFQLEVNNQYEYLFKDAPNDLKAETNHWKLNLAKGYTTAFIGAYVYNALMEQVAGSGAALDPIGIIEDLLRDLGLFDDDEEKEADEVVTNLIENVGEELPFVGGTLFGGGRIPISSAVPYGDNGLVAGIGDFVGDVSEGNWGNVGKEMMNPLLNVGLPVGGGQIKKTMQGLSMFNTDEDHPIAGSYTDSGALRFPVEDTIGNRVQAGIFGQWANKNARNYIENGRKPLNEKQTQEFIDSEMPIADYWKYLDGLKGLKTHAEKADYIDGLDITDEQKNLLMNNVLDRKEDVDMSNYGDYGSFEEFDYAQKNPNKYAFSKVTGGYESYLRYSDDLYDIKADKDAYGKTINGSRKAKVLDYINNLDADYETKIILYKKEYPSDDTYNNEIIEYINGLDDLTYEERIAIYEELGFTVKDGYVYW